MKLDKDFIVKQRFWVLLAVSIPLALAAILMMFTAVSAEINTKRAEVKEREKKLSLTKGPIPNDEWIKIKKELAEKLMQKESSVWANAYKEQADKSIWATSFDSQFNFRDGMFAYEILVERDKEKKLTAPEGGAENNTYYGTVTKVDRDYIMVTAPKQQPVRFQRTADLDIKVTDTSGKPMNWVDVEAPCQVKVTYEKSKYFNDRLTPYEITEYAKTYASQLDDILKLVDPLNEKGEGVVQFKGWTYSPGKLPPLQTTKFFRYVENWEVTSKVFTDEAWLAQEDLWIQREIYRLVRLANDYVGKFESKSGGKNAEAKTTHIFTSPYWELHIDWRGGKEFEITLKNLLNRRQKLGMDLLIRTVKGNEPERIRIPAGEPLEPKGMPKSETKHFVKDELNLVPKGIYEVEQVLTWETAAVKRIDQVSIGSAAPEESSHGNRSFPLGVSAFPARKDDPKAIEGSVDPLATPAFEGKGFPGLTKKLSPNGLVFERYVEVTKQARRIPVGVVLIVDQEHVDRVQTAFGNSKLRFWMTQMLMNRYPMSLRPIIVTPEDTAGPGDLKERRIGRFGIPTTPQYGMPQDMATAGSGDEQEANMELVLYGLMTLYERFPPTPRRDGLFVPAAP